MRPTLLAAALLILALAAAAPAADSAAPGTPPPVRMGILSFVSPSDNEPIIGATVAALRRALAPREVTVRVYPVAALEQAVRNREVDLFQCSAGFYRRNLRNGVRDLASLRRPGFPNPNEVVGAAFITLDARRDIQALADCRGKTVGANFEGSFTGWHVPLGEIAARGWDPDTFFGEKRFFGRGADVIHAFEALAAGAVDVVAVQSCFLENALGRHPELPPLRVLDPKPGKGPCACSTELYPGWTLATAPGADADVARVATTVALTLPPVAGGLSWSIATDFTAVDTLFRTIRQGPYAYLRQWTVRRFLAAYWPALMALALVIAGMIAHGIRAEQLVARRTRQLEATHAEKMAAETAARRATERFDALQKMGVVSMLSSMFAHELGQPLAAISLYAQGLKKLVCEGRATEPVLASRLDQIHALSQRADAIVDKVREYARRTTRSHKPTDLAETAEKSVERFKESRFRGTTVEFSAQPDLVVNADPLEIELAVLNLMRNGAEAQAGPDRRLAVRVFRSGQSAAVSVEDFGGAVTDAAYAALREPLRSTKPQGLGLGVAICATIMEAHGGRLDFERKPTGLTGTILLPLLGPAPDDAPAGGGPTRCKSPWSESLTTTRTCATRCSSPSRSRGSNPRRFPTPGRS